MVFVTCFGSSKVVKNKLVSEIVDSRGESKSSPKLSNPFVVSCRCVMTGYVLNMNPEFYKKANSK